MPERVIVLFLDGVGLGEDDPEANPLAQANLPALSRLLDGRRVVRANGGFSARLATLLPLDAQLGVPGLPQSGTGQTTILTGVNAPALLAAGKPVAYANAYPDRFLDRLKRGTERLSANTRAALLAGLKLRGPTDLKAGRAISGLLTNEYWSRWGYAMPDLSAAEAGAQLACLAGDHALTYFEFWYTDVAGHRQDRTLSLHLLRLLDEFIGGIVDTLDLDRSLLVVLSDHGNFEDWRTARHTHNPALALLVGAGHATLARHLASLADVTPTLLAALGEREGVI
jgi:2,3-bisphosphoglycerate-independent phosphoglycerate mutase